jgi:N-acyl-D-amino-acid deacylase
MLSMLIRHSRPVVLVTTLLAAAVALVTVVGARTQAPAGGFDLVISNGRVVDGTGAPWFVGDVGIRGDRIAAIGDLKGAAATTRIDASGMVVAPGFIDMLGQSEFNVLVDNRAASKIMMGVTTEVTGEGTSIAPMNDRLFADQADGYKHFNVAMDWHTLGEYFTRLNERAHPAINIATFVGAGGLRAYVVGKDNRPATAAELEQMKNLVAGAMEDGALGVSS